MGPNRKEIPFASLLALPRDVASLWVWSHPPRLGPAPSRTVSRSRPEDLELGGATPARTAAQPLLLLYQTVATQEAAIHCHGVRHPHPLPPSLRCLLAVDKLLPISRFCLFVFDVCLQVINSVRFCLLETSSFRSLWGAVAGWEMLGWQASSVSPESHLPSISGPQVTPAARVL